jgi:hypothetical protein
MNWKPILLGLVLCLLALSAATAAREENTPPGHTTISRLKSLY